MDKSRNYILDRLTSKKTSIEEFDYDRLQAPPLSMFLSPFDIQELNYIAKSLKYSAKPEARYTEIDKVMQRRGLVKFAAGTNRVVYRHPEFDNILFKVAADAVGLGDNPAEYRNQFLLKPFVTKCFEVSPCGTVGIFERVNPITSREEFISVADDVFELITEWLIGEYVIADIGSRYFMNFGIRRNFGIVLLDYPYVYKLDGNKLYCRKQDPSSPSGKCDGVIDYDDGFSSLHCTKCGAVYKAKELETKIKNSELIVKREGDVKMKVRVSGGSKNVTKTVNTNEEFNNTNFKEATKKVTFSDTPKGVNGVIPTTRKKVASIVEAVDTSENSEPVIKAKVKKPVETVVAQCKVQVTDEPNKNGNIYEKEVVKKAMSEQVSSPISISEEYKKESLENVADEANEEMSPVEAIENALKVISTYISKISIDAVKDDILDRVINNIIFLYIKQKNAEDVVNLLSEKLLNAIECVDDKDKVSSIESIFKIVDMFAPSNASEYDDSAEKPNSEDEADDAEDDEEETNIYSGMQMYDAVTVNVKDLFPTQQAQRVIVILDEEGNYVTKKIDGQNQIIGIDCVDDKEVNATSLVSTAWLDQTIDRLDNIDAPENDEAEDSEYDDESTGSIPVGVLPPTAESYIVEEDINEDSQEE